MSTTYIVALNSFATGARRYYTAGRVGGRYVDFKAQAARFDSMDAARMVADSEQQRHGRSVIMDVVPLDETLPVSR